MARFVVLDSGPLGLAALPPGKPAAIACQAWLSAVELAGSVIVIPAVADYEVRRELVRLGYSARLHDLDGLRGRYSYLHVSQKAWDRAAEFWAHLRNLGLPTAGPQDLDADAILAGQTATLGHPGDIVTIATTNARHLVRFPGIDARDWTTIR